MSTLNGGPGGIVTSGLVLYLDAANAKSYASGSTVWRDLTYFNNSGSLVNGPTFNSGNGGSIVFDGADDYVGVADNPILNPTLSMTLSTWINIKEFRSNMCMFGKGTQTPGLGGFDFRIEVGGQGQNLNLVKYFIVDQRVTIPTLVLNRWYNILAIQSSTRVDYYIDGNNVGFYSDSSPYQTNNATFKIALDRGNTYMKANISQVLLYNKILSPSEILQNYNSTKARFGL